MRFLWKANGVERRQVRHLVSMRVRAQGGCVRKAEKIEGAAVGPAGDSAVYCDDSARKLPPMREASAGKDWSIRALHRLQRVATLQVQARY